MNPEEEREDHLAEEHDAAADWQAALDAERWGL